MQCRPHAWLKTPPPKRDRTHNITFTALLGIRACVASLRACVAGLHDLTFLCVKRRCLFLLKFQSKFLKFQPTSLHDLSTFTLHRSQMLSMKSVEISIENCSIRLVRNFTCWVRWRTTSVCLWKCVWRLSAVCVFVCECSHIVLHLMGIVRKVIVFAIQGRKEERRAKGKEYPWIS